MTYGTDEYFWFLETLSSRVVAETKIPGDRFHLGKLILQSFKDAPDFILQIDAATGRSESFESVLKRSVKCAEAFKTLGLKKGDVIVLMARNYLDLCIPLYAALYLGVIVAALDEESSVVELESMLELNEAKIVFCQSERTAAVKTALKNIKLDARVVALEPGSDCSTFHEFLDEYGVETNVDTFKAVDFDGEDTIGFLTSTSGTTGLPKSAALTHKNMRLCYPLIWSKHVNFPTPTELVLMLSPIQWLSASFHYIMSPILRYTRLQYSGKITEDQFYDVINKYQPTYGIFSPPLLISLIKPCNRNKGSLTCFKHIVHIGSAVPQELANQIRILTPKTIQIVGYGLSEVSGMFIFEDDPIVANAGRPLSLFQYKLVNADTNEEIVETNVTGELWLKGPGIFKGYYNNPVATAEIFVDGWVKTGDLFYKDDKGMLFFVERLKSLLKYKNHQISPIEAEAVIRQLPGVLNVGVTGFPDEECGDLPVACVVRKKGHHVTAQQIKDVVKNTLTDSKQLRGGVIFLKELPLTAVHKVHRQKRKQIVLSMDRE